MPTIRGTDAGSKKRYAGLVQEPGSPKGYSLVFKGLESVRSDWSPLARDFQRALYGCIFLGQPYAELIFATVASLRAGELDDKLVFTKRLRRRIDDYEKMCRRTFKPRARRVSAREVNGRLRAVSAT
jgi:DNA polymerase-2